MIGLFIHNVTWIAQVKWLQCAWNSVTTIIFYYEQLLLFMLYPIRSANDFGLFSVTFLATIKYIRCELITFVRFHVQSAKIQNVNWTHTVRRIIILSNSSQHCIIVWFPPSYSYYKIIHFFWIYIKIVSIYIINNQLWYNNWRYQMYMYNVPKSMTLLSNVIVHVLLMRGCVQSV